MINLLHMFSVLCCLLWLWLSHGDLLDLLPSHPQDTARCLQSVRLCVCHRSLFWRPDSKADMLSVVKTQCLNVLLDRVFLGLQNVIEGANDLMCSSVIRVCVAVWIYANSRQWEIKTVTNGSALFCRWSRCPTDRYDNIYWWQHYDEHSFCGVANTVVYRAYALHTILLVYPVITQILLAVHCCIV